MGMRSRSFPSVPVVAFISATGERIIQEKSLPSAAARLGIRQTAPPGMRSAESIWTAVSPGAMTSVCGSKRA